MYIILTPNIVEKVDKLIRYAEAHPFSMDDLLDRINHPELSPGLEPEFQLLIPPGIKIVFTIEHQVPGKARHLSVSVDQKYKYPTPEIVQGIMKLVGFKNRLEACNVFEEKLEPGYTAINVLELI